MFSHCEIKVQNMIRRKNETPCNLYAVHTNSFVIYNLKIKIY